MASSFNLSRFVGGCGGAGLVSRQLAQMSVVVGAAFDLSMSKQYMASAIFRLCGG